MTPGGLERMRITATHWKTISRLLDEGLELDSAARSRWLESLAAEHADLGELLRQLFAESGGFETADILPGLSAIAPGQWVRPDAPGLAEPVGENLSAEHGQYRILERLGEGSMGDVYLAEQRAPVQRHVALKILKVGMSTREVIGRFELERQTLALMTHPHIARVFDAGVTQDGRPYFAMEHVPGAALTRYCDSSRLDLDARLRLFGQVCSGVQHAHLRGVIHRDLKPSNILVTEIDGVPTPKIIDFGIAKATTVSSDLRTRLGHILGTPEYMSPEQVQLSPLEIDLRTDVYSLGVVLYELLTGSRPYNITRDAITPGVLEREILAQEVIRPSVRAAERTPEGQERAGHRRSTAQALASRLRGDLDWITLKALEKDRNRRYASAAELAADIERHIRHEVVLAGPPSAVHRLRKLVRRHRVAAATLGALFAAAIVFGSGMAWLAHEAALERNRANNEALLARRVTTFTAGLFELANPASIGSKDVTARELLDAGVARLETQMGKEQPYVRAALLQAAGNAYRGLGAYDRAQRMLESAVALRAADSIHEPQAHAQALLDMALLRREQGDYAKAEDLLRDAMRILERPAVSTFGVERRARLELVEILRRRSKLDEAAMLAEASVIADERSGNVRTTEYARSMRLLGRIRVAQGRLPEAEQILRRALALHRQIDGDLAEATIEARNGLADALVVMGQPAPATPLLREIVRDVRTIYGERHPEVGLAYNNLANALSDIPEHYAESVEVYLKALDIQLETNGTRHPEVATVYNNLGAVYLKLKEWRKADEAYQKSAAIRLAVLGPSDPNTASAQTGRALALNKLGEYVQAEALLRQAKVVLASQLGADHWRTANLQHYLATVLMNERRFAEAERELREARGIHLKVLGAEHPRTKAVEQTLKDLEQARSDGKR
jgi:serine/threonine protein kinase/tetratricopeptide (TPR) repeat protein